jgi:hypothetical protein
LGSDLKVGVDFSVTVKCDVAGSLTLGPHQILDAMGLARRARAGEGWDVTG